MTRNALDYEPQDCDFWILLIFYWILRWYGTDAQTLNWNPLVFDYSPKPAVIRAAKSAFPSVIDPVLSSQAGNRCLRFPLCGPTSLCLRCFFLERSIVYAVVNYLDLMFFIYVHTHTQLHMRKWLLMACLVACTSSVPSSALDHRLILSETKLTCWTRVERNRINQLSRNYQSIICHWDVLFLCIEWWDPSNGHLSVHSYCTVGNSRKFRERL